MPAGTPIRIISSGRNGGNRPYSSPIGERVDRPQAETGEGESFPDGEKNREIPAWP